MSSSWDSEPRDKASRDFAAVFVAIVVLVWICLMASLADAPAADARPRKPHPTPSLAPTATPPGTTPSPSAYLFEDNFDGTTLGPVWGHHWSCCGSVSMDPTLSYVSGGYLHQRVEYRSGRWYADLIDTRDSFTQTYGTYEFRLRVTSKASGLWPAAWLYQGTFGTDGDEIDAVELLGSEGMVAAHESVHKGTQSNQVYAPWSAIQVNDATQFHTYAVDWRPTYIAFYIDGVERWRESSLLISTPKAVLLNLGMGGWGGTPDLSASGAEMVVDYVRVTP